MARAKYLVRPAGKSGDGFYQRQLKTVGWPNTRQVSPFKNDADRETQSLRRLSKPSYTLVTKVNLIFLRREGAAVRVRRDHLNWDRTRRHSSWGR